MAEERAMKGGTEDENQTIALGFYAGAAELLTCQYLQFVTRSGVYPCDTIQLPAAAGGQRRKAGDSAGLPACL